MKLIWCKWQWGIGQQMSSVFSALRVLILRDVLDVTAKCQGHPEVLPFLVLLQHATVQIYFFARFMFPICVM